MLKLKLDELRVETFATAGSGNRKGTVVAAQDPNYTQSTCQGMESCAATCNDCSDFTCVTNYICTCRAGQCTHET